MGRRPRPRPAPVPGRCAVTARHYSFTRPTPDGGTVHGSVNGRDVSYVWKTPGLLGMGRTLYTIGGVWWTYSRTVHEDGWSVGKWLGTGRTRYEAYHARTYREFAAWERQDCSHARWVARWDAKREARLRGGGQDTSDRFTQMSLFEAQQEARTS